MMMFHPASGIGKTAKKNSNSKTSQKNETVSWTDFAQYDNLSAKKVNKLKSSALK